MSYELESLTPTWLEQTIIADLQQLVRVQEAIYAVHETLCAMVNRTNVIYGQMTQIMEKATAAAVNLVGLSVLFNAGVVSPQDYERSPKGGESHG